MRDPGSPAGDRPPTRARTGATALGQELDERARGEFAGRDAELATLQEWTRPGTGPAVVLVHGPPGVGKTTLVEAFAASLPPAASALVACEEIEPTPAGVAHAVVAAAGPGFGPASGRAAPAPAAVAEALAGHRLLVLDGRERIRLVDRWLLTELLPALPTSVTTVLVGRDRPAARWRTSAGWQGLVAELPVGPLPVDAARRLLGSLGVADPRACDAMVRFARGHPLALRLAAAYGGALDAGRGPEDVPEVVEHLVEVFLDGLDPATVHLVRAAASTRRVFEGDLAELVEPGDVPGGPPDRWARLRDLPIVAVGEQGLAVPDLVREAVARSAERRDPRRHEDLRRRAVRVVRDRVARTDPSWAGTADLLDLVGDPIVRAGFFPADGEPVPVEPAGPADAPDVDALLDVLDDAGERRDVRAFLDAHPGSVRVARGPDGGAIGFLSAVVWGEADRVVVEADPVARAWLEHRAARPVPDDAEVLLVRRVVAAGGERSAELAALFVDLKRTYLELRPALRRVYAAVGRQADSHPMLARLGFESVAPPGEGGASDPVPLVLDFGPASVDGWLARLAGADLAGGDPAGGGAALPELTPREREVLALVAQGATNKDVARRLGISPKTVGRHLEHTFPKLGVSNRAAAARLAALHGLVR